MNSLAAALQVIIDALAKLIPAFAAYIAGKKTAEAKQDAQTISTVQKAKDIADGVKSADVVELDRLRNKWVRK